MRLGLYRRLSGLVTRDEIDAFGVELIDRFGPYPQEVAHLLDVMEIKGLCRQAGIQQIDAGPKGAVVALRNNTFPNPVGLIDYIAKQVGTLKLRPDQKLVFVRPWETPSARVKGLQAVLKQMAALAQVKAA